MFKKKLQPFVVTVSFFQQKHFIVVSPSPFLVSSLGYNLIKSGKTLGSVKDDVGGGGCASIRLLPRARVKPSGFSLHHHNLRVSIIPDRFTANVRGMSKATQSWI